MYFKGTKYKPGNVIKSKRYGVTWKILDIRIRKNHDHRYRMRTSDGYNISKRVSDIDSSEHYCLSLKSVLKKL